MDIQAPHIVFRLESYGNLFSDFDPRDYSVRSLSTDFLNELDRATEHHTDGKFRLAFEVPHTLNNAIINETIIKRLHGHFRWHLHSFEQERKSIVRKGIAFLVSGLILIAGATFVASLQQTTWHNIARVLLEPSGWFISWFGFDQIFYDTREIDKKLAFYKKMIRADIDFDTYS